MSERQETVSVIIPAYRSGATIARAISSALNEASVVQVIVVDDASGDDTLEIAQTADDGTGRLILYAQEKNKGPAAARNVAMGMCRGDWIALLDADDYWLSGRLEQLLSAAEEIDFIADDLYQEISGDADGMRRTVFSDGFSLPMKVTLSEFVRSNITRAGVERGELGFIKPLMRRAFLIEKNLFYHENLRLGEDYELYTRALINGARMKILPPCGYVSVVREDSLSARHSIDDLRRLRDCDSDLMRMRGVTAEDKHVLSAHARSIDCRLQWRLLIEGVKTKDIRAAWSTFMRPWPVPIYLLRQLMGECHQRIFKKLCGNRKSH